MDIPPALLQLGSPVLLVVVLWWALAKGNLSTSREVDDIRRQRDKADERAEHLLQINATQSEALKEFAQQESLSIRAMEALKNRAAEKDGA